ncbi:MAG: GNAT family N-acetyltransferase [Caulobacter sp.]
MTQITYRPEAPGDAPLIDDLIERAFGPGRYAKAAERLREGNRPMLALSFTAWDGAVLAGAVRLWTVHVGDRPILFLGPIAVEPGVRSHGVGQRLVERACEAAAQAGWRSIFLVGDAPYFGRVGFVPAPDVVMPGPVDQRRVLWRPLTDEATPPAGLARV